MTDSEVKDLETFVQAGAHVAVKGQDVKSSAKIFALAVHLLDKVKEMTEDLGDIPEEEIE